MFPRTHNCVFPRTSRQLPICPQICHQNLTLKYFGDNLFSFWHRIKLNVEVSVIEIFGDTFLPPKLDLLSPKILVTKDVFSTTKNICRILLLVFHDIIVNLCLCLYPCHESYIYSGRISFFSGVSCHLVFLIF